MANKNKTICEEEFERWWKDNNMASIFTDEVSAKIVWNQAWKTCGQKISDELIKRP
jgi:hypothetical protein